MLRNEFRTWGNDGQFKCVKYDYLLKDSSRVLQKPLPLTGRKGSLCNAFTSRENREYFEF